MLIYTDQNEKETLDKMSVSNLMTNVDEIKANKSSISKVAYREIAPSRNVQGTSFPNGEIIYRFTVSGNSWWIPAKSYLSLKSKLYSTGTTQPSLDSDMAPSPNFTACMFSGCAVRVDDRPLGRISAFLPQIDAIKTRLTRSKAWRDSVGKSTNYWETDFYKRQSSIVSNVVSDPDETKIKRVNVLTGTSVSVAAATGIVTATLTTQLHTDFPVGSTMVIDGVEYQVITASDGTHVTVEPSPVVDVAATTDVYRLLKTYGAVAQKHNIVETVWQPPLGIFDVTTPLPPGNYSIHLTPNTSNYKNSSFESVSAALTTQNVEVERMDFMACTVEGDNAPSDFSYYLDLNEIAVQPKELGSSTSDQVLDFSVAPTTYAMSIATQHKTAGSSTLYPPTKFTAAGAESNLTNLRLTYAGQVQPSPDWSLSRSGNTDHYTKMYLSTLMHSNSYDMDVIESKKEWLALGPISHFSFMKPFNDGSTRVDCAVSYSADPSTANLLMFSHYTNVAQITYRGDRTENVTLSYA